MKIFKKPITRCNILSAVLLSVIFFSCQKGNVTKPSSNDLSNSVASTDEVSLSREGTDMTLTLRPGPDNGQDVAVVKQQGVESGNVNYVDELWITSWTVGGAPYRSFAYIRFDSLSKIPVSSTVASAKLYLYTPSSAISTPQGNSGDNACYVQRVTSSWDETTLAFKNQPTNTKADRAVLPQSTSQWNSTTVVDVTAIVSYFVAHPDENYGFFIHLITQAVYRSQVFSSSEQPDKSLRPKLVVTYQ